MRHQITLSLFRNQPICNTVCRNLVDIRSLLFRTFRKTGLIALKSLHFQKDAGKCCSFLWLYEPFMKIIFGSLSSCILRIDSPNTFERTIAEQERVWLWQYYFLISVRQLSKLLWWIFQQVSKHCSKGPFFDTTRQYWQIPFLWSYRVQAHQRSCAFVAVGLKVSS